VWKAVPNRSIVYVFPKGLVLRILVTGGAGFIGSHLCERFVSERHEVVALDNLNNGSRENLAHIPQNHGFRVVVHDVCEPFPSELFPANQLDRIYHLACPASPVQYQIDPLQTLRTNVVGTMHAMELARKTGARFLLASTSEVYGDPSIHPQPESYWGNVNPIGPRACYNEGKRCAETVTIEYGVHRNVSVRIARIFNTYGPRMADGDGRVVSTFVHQALRNEDITIQGDGLQTRSFCYVDDLVDGLVRLMEHDNVRGPVNLGNPEEVSIADLAKLIVELTGARSRIATRDLPPDDPKRRQPDITLAKKLLGFAPTIDLREGLTRTIAAARK
jgi:UDP-glucuronate decarboxylase